MLQSACFCMTLILRNILIFHTGAMNDSIWTWWQKTSVRVQVLRKRYIRTERKFESSIQNCLLHWRERRKSRGILHLSEVIKEKGAALQTCWGFIDGTVRPISRPGRNQRVMYNGHKKVHSIKFQSIATPNGLIANLYGPVEDMPKCRWQNHVYYMCSNAQFPGMFVWLYYFRVFPDVAPNCPGLLSVIKRTLLKI